MNISSRTPKFILLGIVSASIIAVVLAQPKKSTDPKEHGIRLIMGHNNNEPMHCTEESLNRALSKCDTKTYKIKFHDPKRNVHWEKGERSEATVSMVESARKDIGGAEPVTGLSVSGAHSTQNISFANAEDLKAFVSALDTAP